jgi:drug/metabolite transporter (DMT)-like permease
LFALILGFVFFEEQPDKIALLGMLIVMISGIILLLRNNSIQEKAASKN